MSTHVDRMQNRSIYGAIRALAKESEPELLDLFRAYLKNTQKDWNYILPTELKDSKKDFYILDVRRPEDFKKGHIPGAKNIFWLDLLKPENLKKLPKNKKIVIVCYVGHTASQVLVLLKLLGYDAVGLKFGMGISPAEGVPVAGWVDYGFKTKEG